MVFITRLGGEDFLTLLLVVLFLTASFRLISVVHFAFFVSYFLNSILKAIFALPRPSLEYLPLSIQPLYLSNLETSAGMPSGHAQTGMTVYLLLALFAKNKFLRVVLFLIAILMPISRLYLGVHFVGDVLVGSLIGLTLSALALRWGKTYLKKHAEHFLVFTVLWLSLALGFAAWYGDKAIFVSGGSLLGYLVFASLWGKKSNWQDGELYNWEMSFFSVSLLIIAVGTVFLLRISLKWLLPSWPISDMLRYFLLVAYSAYLLPRVLQKTTQMTKGSYGGI